MLLSTQDQNEVTYNRFKMSLDRYNTYLDSHIDTNNIAPIRS